MKDKTHEKVRKAIISDLRSRIAFNKSEIEFFEEEIRKLEGELSNVEETES